MSAIKTIVLEKHTYEDHDEVVVLALAETKNPETDDEELNPLYTIEIMKESRRFGGAVVDINFKSRDKKIAVDIFNLLKKAEITFDKY